MAVCLKTQAAAQNKVINGTVVRVLDGDTVTVMENWTGKLYRIRLASIDAPEKDQPYGREAMVLLRQLAYGKEVEAHVRENDKYQRLVAHVFVGSDPASRRMCANFGSTSAGSCATDGYTAPTSAGNSTTNDYPSAGSCATDLCCVLLQQGAAWHLSYFDRHDENYMLHHQLEQQARNNKIGLWATPYPIAPWKWRQNKKLGGTNHGSNL